MMTEEDLKQILDRIDALLPKFVQQEVSNQLNTISSEIAAAKIIFETGLAKATEIERRLADIERTIGFNRQADPTRQN